MDIDKDFDADDFIPQENSDSDLDESAEESPEEDVYEKLFEELTNIIESASNSPALAAWMIGEQLRKTLAIISQSSQAKKAFNQLQKNISSKFGKDYTKEKLYEFIKIADEFPDMLYFSELSDVLSLEHFQIIIKIESDLERTYYCEMARQNKWTPAVLQGKIDQNDFESNFNKD